MSEPRRTALAVRIVGLTAAVAAVAVLVAVIVAYPLIRAASVAQGRETLANLADLTTEALARGGRDGRLLPRPLNDILVAEEVTGYVLLPGQPLPDGVDPGLAESVLDDGIESAESEGADGPVLAEARALGNGAVLLLTQPVTVAGGVTASVIARFLVALVAGLVIAVIVGVLVARRIARPLREAQQAANAMAAGSRDVRLAPTGAAEVADIAVALNRLSTSLDASERRQREFLLSVSHELRTPLTGIQGFGEAMADGVVAGDDVARSGATIAAEAQRLNRLVTDLLDLGRAGAVDFRIDAAPIDLTELARDAGAVWSERCAREGVGFRLDATDPVMALADPTRVRQILDNLLENALRVSPSGSIITVAVSGQPWPALAVIDAGPGLTAEDMAMAFEPGALHERYRGVRPVGTGLGLALVGRLAVRMGGAASVAGAAGGGTVFTVRLPAAP